MIVPAPDEPSAELPKDEADDNQTREASEQGSEPSPAGDDGARVTVGVSVETGPTGDIPATTAEDAGGAAPAASSADPAEPERVPTPPAPDVCDHAEAALTADEHIAIAEATFTAGDVRHAAVHVAAAITTDPANLEWLSLLERIVDHPSGEDLDALFPIDSDNAHFATVAAHAYASARRGNIEQAFDFLMQVVSARPDLDYGDWVHRWFPDVESIRALTAEQAARGLQFWLSGLERIQIVLLRMPGQVEKIAPFMKRLAEAYEDNAHLLALVSTVYRKIEFIEDATRLGKRAYELQPAWFSAINLALAYRAGGDLDAAMDLYKKAIAHDPKDQSARLDLGDMLLEHGQSAPAMEWYQNVLNETPQHPWALPSLLFAQWTESGEPALLDQLEALAREDPPNQRAHMIVAELTRMRGPYVGYLPEPADALINLLKEIAAAWTTDPPPQRPDEVTLSVSALEAPSALLAWDIHTRSLGLDAPLVINVEKLATPDPRQPVGPVEFVLWQYDGTKPQPAPPPPREDLAQVIAQLACQPFDVEKWSGIAKDLAAQVVEQLGKSGVTDLLAILVRPPAPPEGAPGWLWVQRVQTAAALVLAHTDSGPWAGSMARSLLTSLLRGPMDWTVSAAVIALTQLAHERPEIEADVLGLFQDQLRLRPDTGFCCWEHALICCMLRLPSTPEKLREQLEQWRAKIEATQQAG